jgi:antitoxin VapB
MALHITDPQTDKLARKVARRAGESLTKAIRQSLAERLERLEGRDKKAEDAKVRALLAIAARTSPELRAEKKTGRELIEELYDEDGLPR